MICTNLLWVNVCCSNARLHAILNSNKNADLIMVQEPWFDTVSIARSDSNPEGVDIQGTVANPLWEAFLPHLQPRDRSEVAAYWRISSTHFTVANRLDLASNYHMLTLDVHSGADSFWVYNIYHDAHSNDAEDNDDQLSWDTRRRSLSFITDIEIDPMIPTVLGGNFNTHARTWSPLEVRQSPWAIDLEEWVISQALDLLNPPGIPTCRGDRRQHDTTIDLIWINEAASLEDAFHELDISFAASLGSDHAALGLTFLPSQAICYAQALSVVGTGPR